MDSSDFIRGPHERRPFGASSASAHRSTMGEVTWLSIREAGFESPAVHLARVTTKRQPDLGPFIGGPGRASLHQHARS